MASPIFRTYFSQKINLSSAANKVHRFLFKKVAKSAGKTKEDADMLTEFFKAYKKASLSSGNNFGEMIEFTIFKNTISVPKLDFTLGGNADTSDTGIGGVLFEKELQSFLTKNYNKNDSTLGSSVPTVNIPIGEFERVGAKNQKKLENFVLSQIRKEVYNDIIENSIVKIEQALGKIHTPVQTYLKIGVSRSGKIDVAGANTSLGSAEMGEANLIIEGEETPAMIKIKNLLETSTFSVKSYLTEGSIHLGNTYGGKAVSAIANYAAAQGGLGNTASAVALHYLRHPDGLNENVTKGQEPSFRRLYEHYKHMREVYELSGMGLQYEDILESGADFLIVNRASSDEINVYSIKDLMTKIERRESLSLR